MMTGVLVKRGRLDRDRHSQREDDVKTQGEGSNVTGVMNVSISQGLLTNPRSWKRQGRIPPLEL